jgi:hypothetical protein
METQKEKQKYIDFSFVKEHADFEQVLGYYQLTVLRRSGKQLTLRCPFHDDIGVNCAGVSASRTTGQLRCSLGREAGEAAQVPV